MKNALIVVAVLVVLTAAASLRKKGAASPAPLKPPATAKPDGKPSLKERISEKWADAKEEAAAKKAASDAEAAAKQAERDAQAAQRKADEAAYGSESTALHLAKRSVLERLKAPADADFPWFTTKATHLGAGKWLVTGEVDAINAFNAKLRHDWAVQMHHVGGNEFAVDTVAILPR